MADESAAQPQKTSRATGGPSSSDSPSLSTCERCVGEDGGEDTSTTGESETAIGNTGRAGTATGVAAVVLVHFGWIELDLTCKLDELDRLTTGTGTGGDDSLGGASTGPFMTSLTTRGGSASAWRVWRQRLLGQALAE